MEERLEQGEMDFLPARFISVVGKRRHAIGKSLSMVPEVPLRITQSL